MQLANVKQASKPLVLSQAISQSLIKQSEKLNANVAAKVAKVADANKTASFNRFLEAYGDCV